MITFFPTALLNGLGEWIREASQVNIKFGGEMNDMASERGATAAK